MINFLGNRSSRGYARRLALALPVVVMALLDQSAGLSALTSSGPAAASAPRAHASSPTGPHRLSFTAFDGVRLGEDLTKAARHLGGHVKRYCPRHADDVVVGAPPHMTISDEYGEPDQVASIVTSAVGFSGPRGIRVGMTIADAKAKAGPGLRRYVGPATGRTVFYLRGDHSTFAFAATGGPDVALIGIYQKQRVALGSIAGGWGGC